MPWKHWSPQRLGVALALIAAFGFSFKAIFIKLAYAVPQTAAVDAVTLLSLRMLFALPVFVWVAYRSGRSAPPLCRRDWITVAALGMVGYYGASIFDFIGLQYISAGLERLILFTYPTLTVLIGALFMSRPIQRRESAALFLTYAGIALAFVHDLRFAGETSAVLIGGSFVFASSLAYALYLTGSASMIERIGTARFTALTMIVSTLATQIHFFFAQPVSALNQPLAVYAYSAAMALFSTVLPVFTLAAAIRRIGPSPTALIGTLGPVLTIAFGWWLLGEPLSPAQMVGAGFVIAGVVLTSRK